MLKEGANRTLTEGSERKIEKYIKVRHSQALHERHGILLC
jgi:hypothetical protein